MVGSGRSTADDAWVPEAERATIDEGMKAREPVSEREQAVAMDPGSAGGCSKRGRRAGDTSPPSPRVSDEGMPADRASEGTSAP
ncbi:MAG: hypothetical protein AAGF92_08725 [Myxococcota bacterium]